MTGSENYFTRGTTPDFHFVITEDLSDWDVYVTFSQRGRDLVTVHPVVVERTEDGSAVSGRLTQEDTLKFNEGDGEAQVRAYRNGAAGATGCWPFEVRKVLLPGVIPREVGA